MTMKKIKENIASHSSEDLKGLIHLMKDVQCKKTKKIRDLCILELESRSK